ncbi:MAG: hypothetical protein RLZZ303_2388 [Candidatus Hydrogenedentota bacterium]
MDCELCPICSRENRCGEGDCCEHFFGLNWDGDIIWSDSYDKFAELWYEISAIVDECVGEVSDYSVILKRLTKGLKLPMSIVGNLVNQSSAKDALVEALPFQKGMLYSTDGMASGSGYTLYLKDRAAFKVLLDGLRRLRERLPSQGDI